MAFNKNKFMEDTSYKSLIDKENALRSDINLKNKKLNKAVFKFTEVFKKKVEIDKEIKEYEKEKIERAEEIQQLEGKLLNADKDKAKKIKELIISKKKKYDIVEEKQKNSIKQQKALLEKYKIAGSVFAGISKLKETTSNFFEDTFGLKTDSLFSFIVSAISAGMEAAQASVKTGAEVLLATYKENDEIVGRMENGLISKYGSSVKDAVSEESKFIQKARLTALAWGDKGATGSKMYVDVAKSLRGGEEKNPESIYNSVKSIYMWTNKLGANKGDILGLFHSLTSTFTTGVKGIQKGLREADSIFNQLNGRLNESAYQFSDLWRMMNKSTKGLEGYGLNLEHVATVLASSVENANEMGMGLQMTNAYVSKMSEIFLEGKVPEWMKFMVGEKVINKTFKKYFKVFDKFQTGEVGIEAVDSVLINTLKKAGIEGTEGAEKVEQLEGMGKMLGGLMQGIAKGEIGSYSGSMVAQDIIRGSKEGMALMYHTMQEKLDVGKDSVALLKKELQLADFKQAYTLQNALQSKDKKKFIELYDKYRKKNKKLTAKDLHDNVYDSVNKAVNLSKHGMFGEIRKLVFGVMEKLPGYFEGIFSVFQTLYRLLSGNYKEIAGIKEHKVQLKKVEKLKKIKGSKKYKSYVKKVAKGEEKKITFEEKQLMKEVEKLEDDIMTKAPLKMVDYRSAGPIAGFFNTVKKTTGIGTDYVAETQKEVREGRKVIRTARGKIGSEQQALKKLMKVNKLIAMKRRKAVSLREKGKTGEADLLENNIESLKALRKDVYKKMKEGKAGPSLSGMSSVSPLKNKMISKTQDNLKTLKTLGYTKEDAYTLDKAQLSKQVLNKKIPKTEMIAMLKKQFGTDWITSARLAGGDLAIPEKLQTKTDIQKVKLIQKKSGEWVMQTTVAYNKMTSAANTVMDPKQQKRM